jgi:hypothetical protein
MDMIFRAVTIHATNFSRLFPQGAFKHGRNR